MGELKRFKVYPTKGKMFILSCERFEARENRFVLYDWNDKESSEGILCFAEIAAIIPETQRKNYTPDPIRFSVYLKDPCHLRDNEEPIEVFAHAFKTDGESGVTFFGQERDMTDKRVTNEWPIKGIYVATSELLAILPSDGLDRRNWK